MILWFSLFFELIPTARLLLELVGLLIFVLHFVINHPSEICVRFFYDGCSIPLSVDDWYASQSFLHVPPSEANTYLVLDHRSFGSPGSFAVHTVDDPL